jgi:hypothetical protein
MGKAGSTTPSPLISFFFHYLYLILGLERAFEKLPRGDLPPWSYSYNILV